MKENIAAKTISPLLLALCVSALGGLDYGEAAEKTVKSGKTPVVQTPLEKLMDDHY